MEGSRLEVITQYKDWQRTSRLLIKDLEKEMTQAELKEKDGQEDYETFMKDSATKHVEDSKTTTDKEGRRKPIDFRPRC